MSIEFFKTVQNKMHWAVTGHAAALEKAEREYDKFNNTRSSLDNASVEQLEAAVKNVGKLK